MPRTSVPIAALARLVAASTAAPPAARAARHKA